MRRFACNRGNTGPVGRSRAVAYLEADDDEEPNQKGCVSRSRLLRATAGPVLLLIACAVGAYYLWPKEREDQG
jgi:hypothetical protein